MGRLTKDPEVKQTETSTLARFSIAVDRRFKKSDEASDFFDIVAFGKQAEFVSSFLKKGVKIVMEGRLQNNNYTNKEGKKVYANQIVAESLEFAESKKAAAENEPKDDGFMKVPDNISDEDLPFN